MFWAWTYKEEFHIRVFSLSFSTFQKDFESWNIIFIFKWEWIPVQVGFGNINQIYLHESQSK